MRNPKAMRVDPIAEANRQWIDHGWGESALGMSAVTSIARANQIFLLRIEAALKPFKLSFARYELLRLLAFSTEGRLPMASVVNRLQVHPASVTSAVDRLVRDGLVQREAHPEDGRATLLALTSEAHALIDEATFALNEGVFKDIGLSREDAQALIGVLARFRKQAGDFADARPQPEPLENW